MKPVITADKISLQEFKAALSIYDGLSVAKLPFPAPGASPDMESVHQYMAQSLAIMRGENKSTEQLRYETVPELLALRQKDGDVFMEKPEITGLVEWKLGRTNSRAGGPKPVYENTVLECREHTRNAFRIYVADHAQYTKALTALQKLKGVQLATATLLLSVYDPATVPYFSDELYRWLHYSTAKSGGWDRKVSYTQKEYKDMYAKVQAIRERFGKQGEAVTATDIEKVAHVLSKKPSKTPASVYPPSLPSFRLPIKAEDDSENGSELQPPLSKKRKGTQPKPLSSIDIGFGFDAVEACYRKGPNGSPTYDELGFELDYEKVGESMRPRKRPSVKRFDQMVEENRIKREREAALMGILPGKVSAALSNRFQDRVSRDLGIPFHKAGLPEYEEWHQRGYRAQPGEFEMPVPQEEDERIIKLTIGSAFRK